MTSSFPSLFLVAAGLLIADVSSIAITSEKTLMRSERGVVEMQASGAMQQAPPKQLVRDQQDDEQDAVDAGVAKETDMCDVDFPMGKDACHCADEEKHSLILQEEMCIQAANEAGVTAPVGAFRIGSEFFHKRPKGCFKYECSEDPKGVCYFFNPIGNIPAMCDTNKTDLAKSNSTPEVKGLPVCKRAKFMNGTEDSNEGCPTGYDVIMNENNCSEAGICLGYCEGAEFRRAVANESRRDEFPEGCFIHKSTNSSPGCVYYNPPLAGWGKPKKPVGTPVCQVRNVTSWAHLPLSSLYKGKGQGKANDTKSSADAKDAGEKPAVVKPEEAKEAEEAKEPAVTKPEEAKKPEGLLEAGDDDADGAGEDAAGLLEVADGDGDGAGEDSEGLLETGDGDGAGEDAEGLLQFGDGDGDGDGAGEDAEDLLEVGDRDGDAAGEDAEGLLQVGDGDGDGEGEDAEGLLQAADGDGDGEGE